MPITHLKAGSDLATVAQNALALMREKGWPKAAALNQALMLAGYRPPDFPTLREPAPHPILARSRALILAGASAGAALRQAARENAKALANARLADNPTLQSSRPTSSAPPKTLARGRKCRQAPGATSEALSDDVDLMSPTVADRPERRVVVLEERHPSGQDCGEGIPRAGGRNLERRGR